MTELPANLFEQQLFRFLQRKGQSIDESTRGLLSSVIDAAVNQHSCIDVSDKSSDDLEALKQLDCLGEPGEAKPFLLFNNKLYLSRYFEDERQVAMQITDKNRPLNDTVPASLKDQLDKQFGIEPSNRQKLAAYIAVTRQLAIITGGPGTGKTSTVARILDILLEDNPDLVVRLAAGKTDRHLADQSRRSWGP